ncbi:MAG: hypothetical protein LBF97_01775, partial [Elusimicrobiota bacterium]|nr:hypothetical protein [Elusimicrobiota bacterium]
MKFNDIVLLFEWKEDLKEGNKILHYTNARGLQRILVSGIVKAKQYDYSLDQEESKEVSLIRKSASPIKKTNRKFAEINMTDKMRQITDKDVEVEIIIDSDKLKSSVRGIKQSPIAEYVVKSLITTKKTFNEIVELLKDKPIAQRSVFVNDWNNTEYKKNFSKFIQDYQNARKFLKIYAHDLSLKGKNEEATKLNDKNNALYFYLGLYEKYHKQREGEERVNKDIPLNSKYLQIRLLEPILTSKYKNDEYLRGLIKKNDSLFIKN